MISELTSRGAVGFRMTTHYMLTGIILTGDAILRSLDPKRNILFKILVWPKQIHSTRQPS